MTDYEVASTELVATCELCGNQPAWPLELREVNGRILWFTTRAFSAVVCAKCAEDAYYRMQSRTLSMGWWAILFFIGPILTIVFGFKNMKAIKAHRAFGAFSNEGPRILKNARKSVGVWVAAAVIVAIAGYTISVEAGRADRDSSGEINNAGTLLVADLSVGDCFNSVKLGNPADDVPTAVDAVPCTVAHSYELISDGIIPSSEISTYQDSAVSTWVDSACSADFESYIGVAYEDSVFELVWFYPDKSAWKLGSHDYQCIAEVPGDETIDYSVKDSMY